MTQAPPAEQIPSRTDPTVWRASRLVGGPWGRYARPGSSWWTPLRALLLLASFTLLLAYGQKAPCANGEWTANTQYTHVCYSDVIPLWDAERLDAGAVPYRDNAVEYPVLTGGFMWVTAGVTRAVHAIFTTQDEGILFGMLTALALAACGLLTVAGTAGAAGRRPWDAAIFALSPLLIFHAFSNWDLLAMSLTAGAMWAWARSRPVAAGVLIGLGVAAKLYPVFLLLPIIVLAIRTARYRPAIWCTVATVATWLAVNLPFAAAYYGGWREFYAFSVTRDAEASTIWYIGHYLATTGIGNGYASAWSPPGNAVAMLLLLALAVVAALGLFAPARPRLAQLAFLAVFAFLITTKVWSPQYSLWLVPLVALARPRWRISLLWQFSEIGVWVLTLLWLLGYTDSAHGIDYGWLMAALLIRDAFLFAIAGLIVYEMCHPSADVVRASGLDDPGGGPYDLAPDIWGQRFAAWRADGFGVTGLVCTVVGALSLVLSLSVLHWADDASFTDISHSLNSDTGVWGVASVYFGWLAWTLAAALIVVAVAANQPTRTWAAGLLRALGALISAVGIVFTFLGIYLSTDGSYGDDLQHVRIGFYGALAGFLLAGVGAWIGRRPRRRTQVSESR